MSLITKVAKFLKMRAREFIIVSASTGIAEAKTPQFTKPDDWGAEYMARADGDSAYGQYKDYDTMISAKAHANDPEPFDIAAMNKQALDKSFADIYKNKDLPEPVAQEPEDPYADVEDVEAVKRMIKQHEGRRLNAYADDPNNPDNPRYYSIGYGHQITPDDELDRNSRISDEKANELFDQDFPKYYNAAKNVPGWDKMSSKQRGAVVDLTYNMGTQWYKNFPKFSAAAAAGDWERAAAELKDSRWYNQVGYRGRRIVDMMRRGGNYRDDIFYAGNKNNIDDLFKG
jgi:GH24 family phage-related lysozyme (muramidase)